MPMAGAGSRFYKNGYIQPKPIIEIAERPFFYWGVRSVQKFVDIQDITFVVLKDHIDRFNLNGLIHKYFPDADIIHSARSYKRTGVYLFRGLKKYKR